MKKTRKILVCLLAMVFCFTSLGITAFADVTPANVVGTSEAGIATISDGSTLTTVVAPAPAQPKLTKAQKAKLNKIKKLSKPTLKSVKKGENLGEVVITVKSKVKNATGYEFYKSTKKSSGFKKVAKVQTLSTTATGLNGKYYYKVRAYLKKPNGKTIYSKYSAVKSLDSTVKVAKATYPNTIKVADVMKVMGLDMNALMSVVPEIIGKDLKDPAVIAGISAKLPTKKTYDLTTIKGIKFATTTFAYSSKDDNQNNWTLMLRAKDETNAKILAEATKAVGSNPSKVNPEKLMDMFKPIVGYENVNVSGIDFNKVLEIVGVDMANPLTAVAAINKPIEINSVIDALGGIPTLAQASGMVDIYTDSAFLSKVGNLKLGDMLFSFTNKGINCIVIL